MQKTQVWSLDQKDPLEKEMATHSSILACKIPWTEEPGRLTVRWVTKSQTWLSDLTSTTNGSTGVQNSYNSNIKDHWSQITITDITIMKSSEIMWKLWLLRIQGNTRLFRIFSLLISIPRQVQGGLCRWTRALQGGQSPGKEKHWPCKLNAGLTVTCKAMQILTKASEGLGRKRLMSWGSGMFCLKRKGLRCKNYLLKRVGFYV